MSEEFKLAIDIYCNMTAKLPLYNDHTEVENILLWRDEIQDEIDSGVVLTPDQARALREADDRLLAQRDRLVADFSSAFTKTESVGPRHWWWHLDKGPHVREEAERAA